VVNYGKIFLAAQQKFKFIPYGLYISGEGNFKNENPSTGDHDSEAYIFSAGRSGRDYETLIAAVRGLDLRVRIVCDRASALAGIELPSNVVVLDHCYGAEYVRELAGASMVVIPLLVDNISSGQMVLIQAMAYRKPIVITRTVTIQEYVVDLEECLLVPRSDVAALRSAIESLNEDAGKSRHLAAGARRAYEQRFCMRAYVENLVTVVQAGSSTVRTQDR